ncbi:hypothetical protein ACFQ77_39735 [Streptomyces virginiae]|uniref:hypothetical protein n=1 Tax=Streptomyces virginiae TaxID=1961 RepID=UPI0036C61F88
MTILKKTASADEGGPRSTTDPTTAALLPLAVMLPAVTVMFHDRFGAVASAALVAVSLVLVAAGGALLARTTAQADAAAARARRDADVLDALEPLAGARR